MPRLHACLVLSGLFLCVAGCSPDEETFLQNPVTGDTVTCNSNYGRSSFLLTQFTGNHSATRNCVAAYEGNGFLRLN